MTLDKISILNYKNLAQVELDFSSKINCFIGDNGMGKTNILDAIHFLSFCKSSTTTLDTQIIKHDADCFMLQGEYSFEDGNKEKISIGGKKGLRKSIKRGEKPYKRMTEHIGLIPLVLISPNDNLLVTGYGDERRKFMDMVISQYNTQYLQSLTRYGKALMQRNQLIKQPQEPDWSIVEIYEQIMTNDSNIIYNARKQFIEELSPVFINMYSTIANNREIVSLSYKSQCEDSDLAKKLKEGRAKERIVGHSLYGIHRDDIEMTLNGFSVKKEGSQGQNKTFVLALKFAQFEYLKNKENKTPIILLDDIFDKLDKGRVESIMHLVSSELFGQIFVTDTNRDHLDMILSHEHSVYKIFNVKNGITNAQM